MKVYYIITEDAKDYYILASNHKEAMKIVEEKINEEVSFTKVYLSKLITGD